MTTQAYGSAEPAKSDSTVSVAKLTMIGGVAVALIGLAGNWLTAHSDPRDDTSSAAPTTIAASSLLSVDQVGVDGSDVAVNGTAAANVESVVVGIGPRTSGGKYWTAAADVYGGEWKLVVKTEPSVPSPYRMKVWYKTQSDGVSANSYDLTTTTAPVPAPGGEADCAAQYGDACFTGPGWHQPSEYQGS